LVLLSSPFLFLFLFFFFLLLLLGLELRSKPNVHFCSSFFEKKQYKAIKSIRNYPLPITSGQEAAQLGGIGPYIASKVDDILKRGGGGGGLSTFPSPAQSNIIQPQLPNFPHNNADFGIATNNFFSNTSGNNNSNNPAILLSNTNSSAVVPNANTNTNSGNWKALESSPLNYSLFVL
jgi:hypothetical protein